MGFGSVARLQLFDTPTICNALELIDDSRRNYGYTTETMHYVNPSAGPVAGYARTATMRSEHPSSLRPEELTAARLEYYAYMYENPSTPKICVMQDIDPADSRHGPFWGEFNTRIHRAMGFRGIVTDGCVRDLRKLPSDILLLSRGLRPSHANVHVVSFGKPVEVFGMAVRPGDIVHADEHGAVCFPAEYVELVSEKAVEFMGREAPVIDSCKKDELTLQELRHLYLARSTANLAGNVSKTLPSSPSSRSEPS
jgi:regulator of RNase E activity RraA